MSQFICSEGCGFGAPLTEVVYRCRECAGLLEVRHPPFGGDAAHWRAHFEAQWGVVRGPRASGVWGKKAWVLPGLPDERIVTLGEGRTPMLPLPRMAAELGLSELHVKQCGIAATGSFKDLGMTVLVSQVAQMREVGVPVRAVVCASTGDTSAALAAYCAAAGIPAVVLLPRAKVTLAQLVQPLANGAHVLSLETDFDGCMKVVQALSEDPTLYLANSMNALRLEGQKTVGLEICQQLGWEAPDWIVIPGGNLGNVTALGMGLLQLQAHGLLDRLPRIAVAQAQKANPLFRAFRDGFKSLDAMAAERTLASAIQIGNPVSFRRAVRTLRQFDGVVMDATEEELANAAARADLEGAFADPHTGVALAALEKLVAQGTIGPRARAVVVSTAHGLKFTEFKSGYHARSLEGIDARRANAPVEVGSGAADVRAALHRLLDRPVGIR
jgi:threonine synthase